MAMRLRGIAKSEVWLFDAGEGAMAQLQRSNMRVGLVRNIFITHLHGDHLYGLPGLVMSVLGRRDMYDSKKPEAVTLNVYGPQGIRPFLRMALGVAGFRIPNKGSLQINELIWPTDYGPTKLNYRHKCSSAFLKCPVRRLSFEEVGRDIEPVRGPDGRFTYHISEETAVEGVSVFDRRFNSERGPASVVAAPILHTIPTFAYGVTENVILRRFDKSKLIELNIPTDGRDEVRQLFQKWLGGERAMWRGREIEVADVMQDGRLPRRICVVGDTYNADGAAHIAKDVDVLVHEATNMAAQTHMARSRGHSSSLGATNFAKRVGAKRLILNHASVSYSEWKMRSLELEARGMFGAEKAFVARDLSVFNVPTNEEDGEGFIFRRFVGFADSLEFKWKGDSPFSEEFGVERDEENEEEEIKEEYGEDEIDEDEIVEGKEIL